MGATVCPLFDPITINVNSYKDLVVSFVSILKLVAERKLPKTYDYPQLPAPSVQVLLTFNEVELINIRLLKILALLGSGDKQSSEKMYMVVSDIFRKCDSTNNMGNVVLYECICCVSAIYPNPKLLEQGAQVISSFLKMSSMPDTPSLQTMNKVFEHAGDLVNVKVAHNLMKLIAEGFGEDDDSADSQEAYSNDESVK
ncbi:Hypothetical predicted protein, partial [Prunus dulcis]